LAFAYLPSAVLSVIRFLIDSHLYTMFEWIYRYIWTKNWNTFLLFIHIVNKYKFNWCVDYGFKSIKATNRQQSLMCSITLAVALTTKYSNVFFRPSFDISQLAFKKMKMNHMYKTTLTKEVILFLIATTRTSPTLDSF